MDGWTAESRGADETRRLGEALGRAALPLPPGGLVVALHGDLGAGKTVLVQGIARGVGVPPGTPVVSPTFTVARDYPAARGVALHHVDAYRLRGPADLEAAGFDEMWGDGRLTCVEWAERVEDAMPPDRLEIRIEHAGPADPDRRRLRAEATGPASARVLAAFAASAVAGGGRA